MRAIRTGLAASMALAACLASAISRGAPAGSAGTAGASPLETAGSVRSLGMAGAGMADLRDPAAVLANPAALAALSAPEVSFMHGFYLQGVTFDQFAAGGRTPIGAFGGGITLLGFGRIDRFDASGVALGSFAPDEETATVGWAWPGGMWAAGAALTWYRSRLAEDATAAAYAGDVGGSVTPIPALTIAAAVQHIGTGLEYDREAASLPLTIRGGAAFRLPDLGVVVSADAVKPSDGDVSVRAGAEKSVEALAAVTASIRAGWRTDAPEGSLGGLAAGAEVYWHPEKGFGNPDAADIGEKTAVGFVRGFRLSYAWTPLGELGSAHWIAVALAF